MLTVSALGTSFGHHNWECNEHTNCTLQDVSFLYQPASPQRIIWTPMVTDYVDRQRNFEPWWDGSDRQLSTSYSTFFRKMASPDGPARLIAGLAEAA